MLQARHNDKKRKEKKKKEKKRNSESPVETTGSCTRQTYSAHTFYQEMAPSPSELFAAVARAKGAWGTAPEPLVKTQIKKSRAPSRFEPGGGGVYGVGEGREREGRVGEGCACGLLGK